MGWGVEGAAGQGGEGAGGSATGRRRLGSAEHIGERCIRDGAGDAGAGRSRDEPGMEAVYRRGVAFLLRTQMDDGSWYVRSRGMKLQPYFESGFPYDHDQWISYSATALATAALIGSLGGR